jgi:hypothetical protein
MRALPNLIMKANNPLATTTNQPEKPSDGLFNAILQKSGHPKSKRAAQHIKDACDYFDGKEMEIVIAEVGKFCKNSGPKTQSIHNNKDFCAYIKARRAEQKLAVKPPNGELRFESADPQANAMIYALQAERRRLQQMLQNLKRALSDAGDYDFDATMRIGRLIRAVANSAPVVSPEILDVLRRLLDANHLIRFGLRIQQDRIIAVDRNNRVFMEKADLQRLLEVTQGKSKSLPENSRPKQLLDPDGKSDQAS